MKKKQGIPPHLLPSREEVGSAITLLLSGCSTPDTYERYLRRTNWRVQGDYAVLRQHFQTPAACSTSAPFLLLATLLSFKAGQISLWQTRRQISFTKPVKTGVSKR